MEKSDTIWDEIGMAGLLDRDKNGDGHCIMYLDFKRALPIIEAELTLKWTKEKPSKYGWYWQRIYALGEPAMIHIFKSGNKKGDLVDYGASVFPSTQHYFDDKKEFEWAGPIPEPPKGE